MIKFILIPVTIALFGIANAQQPLEAVFQNRPPVDIPVFQQTATPVQQIVNLGDVVVNVVIAKVIGEGADAELTIAKFGRSEPSPAPRVVTTMKAETRTRTLKVDGEVKTQEYTVMVPIRKVIENENFTPTEKDRFVPVSAVKAFDLKGNPLSPAEWTKRLATPQHVLLIREPINETNKLNPFFTAILREDTMLVFLKGEPMRMRVTTVVYNTKDLPIWSKDGEDLDPTPFIDTLKTKVTPEAWSIGSTIVPSRANQSLVVSANQQTHEAISNLLRSIRDQMAKQE